MNNFKVQFIKNQTIIPPTQVDKPIPKLIVDIETISYLNYPIETLSQIISAHFDQQPCSANLVVMALKVISISLKDNQLKANIQKTIAQNLHKRERVYTLFVYWSNIIPQLTTILSKFDTKIIESALGCVISEYCFTNKKYNSQITQLISNVINQFSSEGYHRISQYVKNESMSISSSFEYFMECNDKINTKNEKVLQFFNDIANSIIKLKQSQTNLEQNVRRYFQDKHIQQKLDIFFLIFPNLQNHFTKSLIKSMEQKKQKVLSIWINANLYKLQHPIKFCVREWINRKQNYWIIFNHYFNLFTTTEPKPKLVEENGISLENLLELGYQIEEDNVVSQFIIKKQLYNYFYSLQIQKSIQFRIKLVKSLTENKTKYKTFHQSIDVMNDILKSYSHNLSTKENVSILSINTIYGPKNWKKTNIDELKNNSYKILNPFIEKLQNMYKKLEKNSNQKGQKIELAFHGIKINIIDRNEQLIVSYQQLMKILKSNTLINRDIQQGYLAVQSEQKKVQIKKQISSIVIEAKIVRVLKKSKEKLNFNNIFSQVQLQLQIPEQSCRNALEKILSKGLAKQQGEGIYIYCP